MKSFHLTVWGIILLFSLVMCMTVAGSFSRKTTACKIDTAEMNKIRELSQK